MGIKLLIIFVLSSFIFLNISDTFGDDRCLDDDIDYTDDPRHKHHTCKKVGDYFCYFPKSDNTIALHFQKDKPEKVALSDEKFSSKFGGCTLYVGYPPNIIRADFSDKRGEIENFIAACKRGDYFSTKIDITYGAYDKGKLIDIDDGVTKIKIEDRYVGYSSGYSLVSKIRSFENDVKTDLEGVVYDREVYTLRVIEAEIKDDKCLEPKHILRDKPISVATKLLLKPKLNDNDNIVYDDKETKKIEVNADQDEFYFGGTLLTIDKQGLGTGRIRELYT